MNKTDRSISINASLEVMPSLLIVQRVSIIALSAGSTPVPCVIHCSAHASTLPYSDNGILNTIYEISRRLILCVSHLHVLLDDRQGDRAVEEDKSRMALTYANVSHRSYPNDGNTYLHQKEFVFSQNRLRKPSRH